MTVAVVLLQGLSVPPRTPANAVAAPLSEPALAFVVALGASSSEEVELQLQVRMGFSRLVCPVLWRPLTACSAGGRTLSLSIQQRLVLYAPTPKIAHGIPSPQCS